MHTEAHSRKKKRVSKVQIKSFTKKLNPWRNLIARLVCFFVLPTVVFLLVTVFVLSNQTHREFSRSIGNNLALVAKYSRAISLTLVGPSTRVTDLATHHSDIQPWNSSYLTVRLNYYEQFFRRYEFSSLIFAGIDGRVLACTNPDLVNTSVANEPWFRGALEKNNLYLENAPTPVLIESAFTSNPILGKNRFIDIAHPVQEFGTSLTVGVLAALLYWDWAEDVVRNEFGDVPDPTPEISLLMNKPAGIVLYPPARERGSRMVYPALAAIPEAMARGESFTEIPWGDETYLVGFAPRVGRWGWVNLIAIPQDYAQKPVNDSRRVVTAVGVTLIFVCALLGLYLAASITRPINKIVFSLDAILKQPLPPPDTGGAEPREDPERTVNKVKAYIERRRVFEPPPTDEVKILFNSLQRLGEVLSEEAELKARTVTLEEDIKNRTRELVQTSERLAVESEERKIIEAILFNIIPNSVAERLKRGETAVAERYDAATIVFADLVGSTQMATNMTASELMDFMSEIFSTYDALAKKYNVELIKTIGDAYFACAGLKPITTEEDAQAEAVKVLEFALEVVAYATERRRKNPMKGFEVRIGINTGSVCAGIIATRRIAFDLWGDAVNVASRMEKMAAPGRIHVSEATYQLAKSKFVFEPRGPIEVRGKGTMNTYWLIRRRS